MSVITPDRLRCTAQRSPDPASKRLSLQDILAVARTIRPYVARTGFYENDRLSELLACRVFVKYENHQPIGSFKIRGAVARMLELNDFGRSRGVVTASQGNHGLGVAYAGRKLGVQATVVVPKGPNMDKVAAIEALGARVIKHGPDFEAALAHAWELSLGECLTFIHPGDDATIIAGHASVALEMFEDVPELDAIVVPVGSGGLAAGVGVVANALRPGCNVLGVQAIRQAKHFEGRTLGLVLSGGNLPASVLTSDASIWEKEFFTDGEARV